MSIFTGTKKFRNIAAFAAAIAVTLMLAGAPLTFAAEAQSPDNAAPATQQKAPRQSGNVYKQTPPGEKSEAYGDAKYGPDHLRRISPTERMPAAPQVEKTIPTGAR